MSYVCIVSFRELGKEVDGCNLIRWLGEDFRLEPMTRDAAVAQF